MYENPLDKLTEIAKKYKAKEKRNRERAFERSSVGGEDESYNLAAFNRGYSQGLQRAKKELAEEFDVLCCWRNALQDAFVCDWIDWDDDNVSFETVKEWINQFVQWNTAIALDPAVSEEAAKLRDTYK